ncbi:DinB/UmuC family translesion DNA polymerase [Pseudomonas oryzae]|uniref:DinB/UmuC family translesion DNA polymerase n=1 Tax=Pseudomonas oryzae TaxID=1392877 RepID=UPI001E513885|nr:hypothetical protein [Pseudomonas oryzae]
MIACSRSFSERITDLEALCEAVTSYTSRAAEKLRAQGDYCRLLQVYIHTGFFNPSEPRIRYKVGWAGYTRHHLPGELRRLS